MLDMWPSGIKNPHETLVDLRWAGALPVGVIEIGHPSPMTPGSPAEPEQREPEGDESIGGPRPVAESNH